MTNLNVDRLKECRQKLGITKQEAAKRIQTSQPAYVRYEAGTRNPSIQTIEKMAEVFSTSVDYLTGASDEPSSDRTIIDQKISPELFMLTETCRDFNDSQLKRLLAYAKELSKN